MATTYENCWCRRNCAPKVNRRGEHKMSCKCHSCVEVNRCVCGDVCAPFKQSCSVCLTRSADIEQNRICDACDDAGPVAKINGYKLCRHCRNLLEDCKENGTAKNIAVYGIDWFVNIVNYENLMSSREDDATWHSDECTCVTCEPPQIAPIERSLEPFQLEGDVSSLPDLCLGGDTSSSDDDSEAELDCLLREETFSSATDEEFNAAFESAQKSIKDKVLAGMNFKCQDEIADEQVDIESLVSLKLRASVGARNFENFIRSHLSAKPVGPAPDEPKAPVASQATEKVRSAKVTNDVDRWLVVARERHNERVRKERKEQQEILSSVDRTISLVDREIARMSTRVIRQQERLDSLAQRIKENQRERKIASKLQKLSKLGSFSFGPKEPLTRRWTKKATSAPDYDFWLQKVSGMRKPSTMRGEKFWLTLTTLDGSAGVCYPEEIKALYLSQNHSPHAFLFNLYRKLTKYRLPCPTNGLVVYGQEGCLVVERTTRPGLYLQTSYHGCKHFGDDNYAKMLCNHPKIKVCKKHFDIVSDIAGSRRCGDEVHSIKQNYLVKTPNVLYRAWGYRLQCVIANVNFMTRRMNIFRIENGETISIMRPGQFWLEGVRYQLTAAGLKRLYLEKQTRAPVMVRAIAKSLGMSLAYLHSFMADIDDDARYPDVEISGEIQTVAEEISGRRNTEKLSLVTKIVDDVDSSDDDEDNFKAPSPVKEVPLVLPMKNKPTIKLPPPPEKISTQSEEKLNTFLERSLFKSLEDVRIHEVSLLSRVKGNMSDETVVLQAINRLVTLMGKSQRYVQNHVPTSNGGFATLHFYDLERYLDCPLREQSVRFQLIRTIYPKWWQHVSKRMHAQMTRIAVNNDYEHDIWKPLEVGVPYGDLHVFIVTKTLRKSDLTSTDSFGEKIKKAAERMTEKNRLQRVEAWHEDLIRSPTRVRHVRKISVGGEIIPAPVRFRSQQQEMGDTGMIETNPGPISKKMLNLHTRVPSVTLDSPTPVDYEDRSLRRSGFLPKEFATESNIFNGVHTSDDRFRAVDAHLSQRNKDCKRSLSTHNLWRKRNMTIEGSTIFKSVIVSQIPTDHESVHAFLSTASHQVHPDYQLVVDMIGVKTHNIVDKRHVTHIVTDLNKFLQEDVITTNMNSIIYGAMAWKACRGCPETGMISVILHPDNHVLNVFWSEETPTSGGQINWMVDSQLFAHCGSEAEGLRPRMDRRTRFDYSPSRRERLARSVTPLRSKILSDTRLGEILGAQNFGSGNKFDKRDVKEFIGKYILKQPGQVEDLFKGIQLGCSIGAKRATTMYLSFHLNENHEDFGRLIETAPIAYPSVQESLDWVQAEMTKNAPLDEDVAMNIDYYNRFKAAVEASQPNSELCSVIGMMLAWKKRWGCPSDKIIAVFVDETTNTWTIHMFENFHPKKPGFYWFWQGKLVGHCGNTDELPMFKEKTAVVSRYLPLIESPYDPKAIKERGNPIFFGHTTLSLRHPKQSSKIRNIDNDGLHGLPTDFLRDLEKEKSAWHEDVLDFAEYVHNAIEMWLRTYNHSYYACTGSCDFTSFPYPIVNFISSEREYAHDVSSQRLDIYTKFNGPGIRGFRNVVAMFPSRAKGILLCNGKAADMRYLTILEPEDDIPMPKSCLTYLYPYGAGNMWIRPATLVGHLSWIQFASSLTVYGCDEICYSTIHVNTVIDAMPIKKVRPFFHISRTIKQPIDVSYYNRQHTHIMDVKEFSMETAELLFNNFFPGRNVVTRPEYKAGRYEYIPLSKVKYQREAEDYFIGMVLGGVISPEHRHEMVMQSEDGKHCPVQFEDIHRKWFRNAKWFHVLSIELVFTILYFYIFYLFRYLKGMANPKYDEDHPFLSVSSEEQPDHLDSEQIKDALIIQTAGTRGDQVPMKLLANEAANCGVITHLCVRSEMTTVELEGLRKGEIWPMLPAFFDIQYSGKLGYKASLHPHNPVIFGKGSFYSLSPPTRYLNEGENPKEWNDLPWFRKVIVKAIHLLMYISQPDVHVGCIKGCQFPRSADGKQLIRKRKNLGTYEYGWTSGSASPEVIPAYIRDDPNVKQIPNGDHMEIFPHYKVIYHHGGAGTAQTAIACGAKSIACDNTLDRNYVRDLTPNDFRQPHIAVFRGWLMSQGFQLTLPMPLKVQAWLYYNWSNKKTHAKSAAVFMARGYLLTGATIQYHLKTIAFCLAVPYIIRRFLQVKVLSFKKLFAVAHFMWLCPAALMGGWTMFFYCLASYLNVFVYLMQDLLSIYRQDYSLIMEPVWMNGKPLPWPFNHYSIRDNQTGFIYEGGFTKGAKKDLDEKFQFKKSRRTVHGGVFLPIACNKNDLEDLLKEGTQPYGPHSNCVTMVLDAARGRSLIMTIYLFFMVNMIAYPMIFMYVWKAVPKPAWLDVDVTDARSLLAVFAHGGDEENTPLAEIGDLETKDGPFLEGRINQPTVASESLNSDTDDDELLTNEIRRRTDPDLVHNKELINTRECLPELMKEIATISAIMMESEPDHHDIIREAANRTLSTVNVEALLPDDKVIEEALPPFRVTTWEQLRTEIHEAFVVCKTVPFVSEFLMWLDSLGHTSQDIFITSTKVLFYLLGELYKFGEPYVKKAWKAICLWLDHFLGEDKSTRIKTVWGPTGLFRSSFLNPQREFESLLVESKFVGKSNLFMEDYNQLVNDLKRHAEMHPVAKQHAELIGGVQHRKISLGPYMMSHNEAQKLGLKEGEYHTDPLYEQIVNEMLAKGVPQGSDGVFFGQREPERIDKSFARYEHQYSRQHSASLEALVIDVSRAITKRYESSFADSKVMPFHAVTKYLKKEYSGGIPFIGNKHTKTRQQLQNLGFLDIMQNLATEYLHTGKFPVEFFHGFEKSQVVDLQKIIEGKNIRTVVSSYILATYMEQIFQLDRNKRDTWEDTGMGSGMPMNHQMVTIWEKMADRMKAEGGRYFLADATEYDSKVNPVLSIGAAEIDRFSFENHPKGKEIASIMTAKYDALQDAWVIGITRPEQKSLCIASHNKETFNFIRNLGIPNLITIHDLADPDKVKQFKHDHDKLHDYYRSLSAPDGSVVLTHGKDQCPSNSHWNGRFEFTLDKEKMLYATDEAQRPLWYNTKDTNAMRRDIKSLCSSDFSMMSRVYDKSRGLGTGATSTTFTNSWEYRIGIITAWCLTTGQRPEEFFEKCIFSNTSDDASWWASVLAGLNKIKDIYTFQRHCRDLGIFLKLETTRDITQVEYLSKTVAPPNSEDSEDLQSWRYWKIQALARAGKLDPSNPEHVKRFNNPRFVLKQNINAIQMRATALRYYQGSKQKWLYTMMTRSCGHAYTMAHRRTLYQEEAQRYCAATNALLKQHNIFQRYEVKWEKQGGTAVPMPHVIQTNPRWTEQKLSPRQLAVLKYIKQQAKFPSYLKVIDVHYTYKDPDPKKHEKFLAKLNKGISGWESAGRDAIDWITKTTSLLPEHWADRFMPGVQALYPDNPYYTRHDYIGRFTLATMLEEFSEDEIDYPMFASRISQGGWGGVTNTLITWENWNTPQWRRDFMSEDPRLWKAMALILSFVYLSLEPLEYIISRMWLIGPLYRFYTWSFWGLKRVYGTANTLYYHSKGKSSTTISSLMPKDQYIVAKRIAATIVDFIPLWVGYLFYIVTFLIDDVVDTFVQAARLYKKGMDLKETPTQNSNTVNPWIEHATPYVDKLRASKNKRLYLSAPTATGKSTFFPSAILAERHKNAVKRIWLVVPRTVLRDEWSIPFNFAKQRLKRGKLYSRKSDIFVCTYGHFLNIMDKVDEENDIVLFDEFHETSGEMILAERKCKAHIFLMSATPVDIPHMENTDTLIPAIKKRFSTKLHKVDGDRSAIQLFQLAKETYPDKLDRALIIVPTVREVREVVTQLQWLGHKGTELSRHQKKVPETGIIVATPYADTGLDIKPGASILIDTGKYLRIDKNQKPQITWTDRSRNKQRIGRTGRTSEGIVIQNAQAGSGQPQVNYPGGFLFEHQVISEYFKVPQLTPHVRLRPISAKMPYLHIDITKLKTKEAVKSLYAIHAISMSGTKDTEFKKMYNKLLLRDFMQEEEWWIDSVVNANEWKRIEMLPWEAAISLTMVKDVSAYSINNNVEYRLPIQPVNGIWHDSFINDEAYEEPEKLKPVILDPGDKLKRVKEIISNLQKTCETITSEAVKTSLFAESNRILAGILTN